MKIEINNEDSNVNKILSYSDNCFKLNNRLIRTNLVISKNRLYEDLLTNNFQDFTLQHLQKIISWHPEIILIEGQSSLRNPSGPCGSELLLSGDVDGVILVHPFDRNYFDNFEDVGCILPSLEDEIYLIKTYGKSVMGVCINSKQEVDALKLQNELKIPVVNPMKESIRAISESIKDSVL